MGYTGVQTLCIRPSVSLRSQPLYQPTASVGRGTEKKSVIQKRRAGEVEHICGGLGYQPKNKRFIFRVKQISYNSSGEWSRTLAVLRCIPSYSEHSE